MRPIRLSSLMRERLRGSLGYRVCRPPKFPRHARMLSLTLALGMAAALFGGVGPTSPASASPATQTVAQAAPAVGAPVAIVYTLGKAAKGKKKYHVHNGTFLGYLYGANTTIGVRIKHVKSWPNTALAPVAEELDVCYPSASHITGCMKQKSTKTGQLVQWQLVSVLPYPPSVTDSLGTIYTLGPDPAIAFKNPTNTKSPGPHNGAFLCFKSQTSTNCKRSYPLPISEQGTLKIVHFASIHPVNGKARLAYDPSDFKPLVDTETGAISAQRMSSISVKK